MLLKLSYLHFISLVVVHENVGESHLNTMNNDVIMQQNNNYAGIKGSLELIV